MAEWGVDGGETTSSAPTEGPGSGSCWSTGAPVRLRALPSWCGFDGARELIRSAFDGPSRGLRHCPRLAQGAR